MTISPEVQSALDAIVQSRLATEKAKQDVEKAQQESLAQQAIKETDKLIFTPDGVFPNLIFSDGAIPSFDINNP